MYPAREQGTQARHAAYGDARADDPETRALDCEFLGFLRELYVDQDAQTVFGQRDRLDRADVDVLVFDFGFARLQPLRVDETDGYRRAAAGD
jgi:hypothetical protein